MSITNKQDIFRITYTKKTGEKGVINLLEPIRRGEASDLMAIMNSGGMLIEIWTKGWTSCTSYI